MNAEKLETTTGSTMETGGNLTLGNSKTKVRICPAKRWCFTLNNYSATELETLEKHFLKDKIKYIIGKEIGENKTPHLQGYIESNIKIRPIEKFETKRIHWEKCKGSREDNLIYCSKEGNFIANGLKLKRQPKIIKDEDLYPWQKSIINTINDDPDDRSIWWIWSKEGMTGKTTFCKYLSHHHDAIPLEGKKNDILYCAAEFESDLYIWDLERSMEDYVSYGALEKIKNGYFMCAKYESKPVIRACPHVFVFANFKPDESKLSKDRWKIINIGTEEKDMSDSDSECSSFGET